MFLIKNEANSSENENENLEEIPEDKEPIDDLGFSDDMIGSEGLTEGDIPLEKHAELLKELMNFEPYIRQKLNDWLGLMWDEEKEKFVKNPLIEPVMNMKGARWCATYLNPYARGNNILTNITHDDYIDMTDDVIDAIWFNLGCKMSEFGIKDYGDVIRIGNELQHTVELALMGAGDGKYSNILKESVHRSETVSTVNNPMMQQPTIQQRQGFVGRFKKLFGGS